MYTVLAVSFIKCSVLFIENLIEYSITGNMPFNGRNMREMFELNRQGEVSFDDSKIQTLSSDGKFLFKANIYIFSSRFTSTNADKRSF